MDRRLRVVSICAVVFSLAVSLSASLRSETSSAATAPGPSHYPSIWVATADGFVRIDAQSGAITHRVPTALPLISVEVDPKHGRVWGYDGAQVTALSLSGEPLVSTPFLQPPGGSADYARFFFGPNGEVWLALESGLYRFDAHGNHVGAIELLGEVAGITYDSVRDWIWVSKPGAGVDGGQLEAYSASQGSPMRVLNPPRPEYLFPSLQPESDPILAIEYDMSRDWLWLVYQSGVQAVSATSGSLVADIPLTWGARQVRTDRVGGLWVVTEIGPIRHRISLLWRFDPGLLDTNGVDLTDSNLALGAYQFVHVPTAGESLTDIAAIAVDPSDGSAFLSNSLGQIERVEASGLAEIVAEAHLQWATGVRQIAYYRDVLPPTLAIVSPLDQAFVSSATPRFELELADVGTGVDATSLSFELDGESAEMSCTADAGFALCDTQIALSQGRHVLDVTAADLEGNVSDPKSLTFTIDLTPPVINLTQPVADLYTNSPELIVSGSVSESSELTVGGESVVLSSDLSFSHGPILLTEGPNIVSLVAIDPAGQSDQLTRTVTLDTAAPVPVVADQLATIVIVSGVASIEGVAGSAERDAWITVTNRRTGETVMVRADANGAFSARIAAIAGDRFGIVVADQAGNESDSVVVAHGAPVSGLPPDPSRIAPALSATGVTPFAEATAFLYTGSNPVQTGVDPETIEPRRAAVVRGLVTDRWGNPIPGVEISIHAHSELGQTLTRRDGWFDMAVNGGGIMTIDYTKDGYLPVQRQLHVPWQDFVLAEDVVMIALDPQVTTIELAGAAGMQVAQGSSSSDADGTRQATVVFPEGTTAIMTLPDGSIRPLTSLNVRATEYTVGENGPRAMPGELPPTSGYTYAVELSVDEAIAAGAKTVSFNQPLPFYVNNFLDFPVGEVVPVGYYDRESVAWIPSDNGRVVGIVAEANGFAELDVDGDGVADTGEALAPLGVTDAERIQLAALYEPGDSLWRSLITHFTPWDCNWPYGPPEDAEYPTEEVPEPDDKEEEPECEDGSIIECQNQVLGESIPIVGTPFTLNYRSDRVRGRKAGYILPIPLSGENVPASLRRIELEISIAGRRFRQSFPAGINQTYTFEWDGRDAFGRTVEGRRTARIRMGYTYSAVYYSSPFASSRAFAAIGTGPVSGVRARRELTLWRETTQKLGTDSDLNGIGVRAWSLDVHHSYLPSERTLYFGSGQRRTADELGRYARLIAGIYDDGSSALGGEDGGLAVETRFDSISGIDTAPDGSIYVAQARGARVRIIDPDGMVHTLAGDGRYDFAIDQCMPEGQADALSIRQPRDLAVGPDGSIYFTTYQTSSYVARIPGTTSHSHCIGRITPQGDLEVIAGAGPRGYSGDGGPAIEATLNDASAIAVAPDGSVIFVDGGNSVIRRIATDGNISTIAGTGVAGFGGDGGPATAAQFMSPMGLDIDADGGIYVADCGSHRVRYISPQGIVTTIAGSGDHHGGVVPTRAVAVDAPLNCPSDVVVDRYGGLYVIEGSRYFGNPQRIRYVDLYGFMTVVAGETDCEERPAEGPAISHCLQRASSVALSGGDDLLVSFDGSSGTIGTNPDHIVRMGPVLPGFTGADTVIPSADGTRLFQFSSDGRHAGTWDAVTGTRIYAFSYDSAGRVVAVIDSDGNETRLERDGSGSLIAVVSPDVQRTEIGLEGNGYLTSVMNPAGEVYRMTYTVDGLLTEFVSPNDYPSAYSYDVLGRLVQTRNAVGGGWALARTELDSGYESSLTSAEGRTTRYRVEHLSLEETLRSKFRPDGSVVRALMGPGGQRTVTAADGTIRALIPSAGPRFGMQAPVPAERITTTPAGLTQEVLVSRSAMMADSDNLLSHTALGETVTVNDNRYESVYDAATRTFTVTTPESRTETTALGASGRPVLSSLSGLAPVAYGYDTRGRLISIVEGEGAAARTTDLAYHGGGPQAGWLASVTDQLGRSVTFDYDLAGRVTRQTLPDGRAIEYDYDANGNLRSLTPPGRVAHVFNYNGVDLTTAYTPPDLGEGIEATYYNSNLDKQLTQVLRPDGATVDIGYNAGSGQMETVSIPRGLYVYDYDPVTGQLASVIAPDGGALDYGWDGFLDVGATWSGTVSGSVAQGFDNDFRVASHTVNGAQMIAYGYDRDGLLTQAGAMSLSRDPQHGLVTEAVLGSITSARGYNEFGEPASETSTHGADGLAGFSYERDAIGRIASITETVAGESNVRSFTYDTAGRLTQVSTDGVVTATYSYDENGNRLTRSGPSGNASGTYDAHDRMLTYGGASYTYTANGELLTKTEGGATTRYDYDVLGNLMQVTLPGDVTIDYVIDGQNRRIGKRVNGELMQGLLYKDQLNPIAELDGQGNVLSVFVYADKPNVPAYMVRDDINYRIISDHLGSPRLVVNADTGEIVQRMDYDEFGVVLLDTNPGFQPFGFAGGIYDVHTGLVRFGARDYDPETGRWTSKDPIGFAGGDANLYGYVLNDPVNVIDPRGEFGIVGATIGGISAVVGTLATGGTLGEAAANGVVGALTGAVPGAGSLIGALVQGAGIGAVGNAIGQGIHISTNPCKSVSDFNFGSLIGSAIGGAITAGRSQALTSGLQLRDANSAAVQIGLAPSNAAISATAGGVGANW